MTLGLSTSGAIKIKTDGGLRAVSCGCCEPPPEDFQSYREIHSWDECPSNGRCSAGGTNPGSCAGATVSGELLSTVFPAYLLNSKTPRAEIWAMLDNFGFVGSLSVEETDECSEHYVEGVIIPEARRSADGIVLVVPFKSINAPHGGPYGIEVYARFYWDD
jgi:hypothetical protein